jgi:hypothetical protein
MVYPEDLVVDEPLDQVEEPPADEHASHERPRSPRSMTGAARCHEDEHANHGDDPGCSVEQPIAKRVEFQVGEAVGRNGRAYHVMPLKDLVEHDSIEEPTQAQPQQHARGDEAWTMGQTSRVAHLASTSVVGEWLQGTGHGTARSVPALAASVVRATLSSCRIRPMAARARYVA